MGMFDYVIISCPHCGEIVEDQTKSFDCILQTINLNEPQSPDIAYHFTGIWKCMSCEKEFYVNCDRPLNVVVKVSKEKPKHWEDKDPDFYGYGRR